MSNKDEIFLPVFENFTAKTPDFTFHEAPIIFIKCRRDEEANQF